MVEPRRKKSIQKQIYSNRNRLNQPLEKCPMFTHFSQTFLTALNPNLSSHYENKPRTKEYHRPALETLRPKNDGLMSPIKMTHYPIHLSHCPITHRTIESLRPVDSLDNKKKVLRTSSSPIFKSSPAQAPDHPGPRD